MADDAINRYDDELVEAGPGAPAFRWTPARERAAFLLADDELSDAAIAGEVGVHPVTLASWKRRNEFRERMREHVKALEAEIVHIAITRKRNRVARLQRLLDRQEQLMAEYGLVIEKPVFSAKGDALEFEKKYDAGLSREYRATLEQVAKELGQLSERIEIEQETIVRRYVGVDMDAV